MFAGFATTSLQAFVPDVEATSRKVKNPANIMSVTKTNANIDFRVNSIKPRATLRTDGAINEASY